MASRSRPPQFRPQTRSFQFAPQQVTPPNQIADAVDRANASVTGGAGKPLTRPHDWSGFDKTFAPPNATQIASRHPNVQSTPNAPLTDAQKASGANRPTNLNSDAVQNALALNANPGQAKITPTTAPTQVAPGVVVPTATGGNTLASNYGSGSSRPALVGEESPTEAEAMKNAETAVASGENGIIHPDAAAAAHLAWQQQAMKEFPALRDANSDENKRFVSAYQDAVKTQGVGKFDPMQLARDTMGQIAGEKATQNQTAQQDRFDDKGNLVQSGDVSGKSVAPPPTPGAPMKGSLPDIAQNAKGSIKDAIGTAGQAVANAENAAGKFLTGNPDTEPMPVQRTQSPAPFNPTPTVPGTSGKEAAANIAAAGGFKPGVDPNAIAPMANAAMDQASDMASRRNAAGSAMGAVANAADISPASTPMPQTPAVASNASTPVPNEAEGFMPQQQDDASWKGNMQAGMNAERADNASALGEEKGNLKAAGFGADNVATPSIDTEQLAKVGGGNMVIPGQTMNYAKGFMPPPFRFPKGPVQAAMGREKTAIKNGVGGALPTDKPEVANLAQGGRMRTAVINSGEKILPAPGGAAVLDRNQQKKKAAPFRFPR